MWRRGQQQIDGHVPRGWARVFLQDEEKGITCTRTYAKQPLNTATPRNGQMLPLMAPQSSFSRAPNRRTLPTMTLEQLHSVMVYSAAMLRCATRVANASLARAEEALPAPVMIPENSRSAKLHSGNYVPVITLVCSKSALPATRPDRNTLRTRGYVS